MKTNSDTRRDNIVVCRMILDPIFTDQTQIKERIRSGTVRGESVIFSKVILRLQEKGPRFDVIYGHSSGLYERRNSANQVSPPRVGQVTLLSF